MAGDDGSNSAKTDLELLKLMYVSREGDRREGVLLRQSKGWFHVAGMGHEALAAIAFLMQDNDYLFPYYRDRAMVLARGVTNRELALAYYAKRESSSGGRQMPGHYSSRSRNIWSVPTPTAANLLPACGAAWGMQLSGDASVVVATTGDAASRQGEFYEAIAFAVERQLPIVFVVEDNRYGISSNTDNQNPFKLGIFSAEIGVRHIDARRPDNIRDVAAEALSTARAGGGPTILVCEVDRLCSHTSSDDHRVYRAADEIAEMMSRDPITVLAEELIADGHLDAEEWGRLKKEIDEEIDREYIEAEDAIDPRPDELLDELLVDPLTAEPPELEGGKRWRMVDAVNEVFKHGLETDRRYVFFGEDIEDPKGGVFGLTSGLSGAFPDRVFNSPLAEATIAGVACGLAGYGMRPVFEMQFIDFVNPAWNQIAQNLATIRWRSAGEWTCPAVIYAPYGAYLPGGSIWHSQANEALFAHIPGLRVVIPSTPEDAAGLMWTAMRADDPTIFLVPKHLFRQQIPVDADVPAVPFGTARIRREGSHVTLVTWGNGIEVSLAAASEAAEIASVEVIDLRSIQPWDRHTVQQSLSKTGRLVVVQEDAVSCSVGQMIISDLTGDPDSWYSFVSPPQLVSRPDVHIGFNPIYEYAALPSVADVVRAVEMVMEE
jgi:2-oxoisovalerate dehydrogenase E1 component